MIPTHPFKEKVRNNLMYYCWNKRQILYIIVSPLMSQLRKKLIIAEKSSIVTTDEVVFYLCNLVQLLLE